MASAPAALAATYSDSGVERATVDIVFDFQEIAAPPIKNTTVLKHAVVDVTCKRCVADPLNLRRCLARVKQPDVSRLLQVAEDFASRLPMRAPGAVVELRQF